MTSSVVLFALVLCIAGGFIAWLGDRLGTHIGKKRLSAFGLRPRHTAMLWTILSGGAIALLTLCVLIAYDRTVQIALLQGAQLLQDKRALTRQIKVEQKQAQTSADAAQAATARQAAAQANLQAIVPQLGAARADLKRSQDALAERQAALDSAQHQIVVAQAALASTHQDLSAARQSVRATQKSLQTAQAQAAQERQTVQALTAQGTLLAGRNARLLRAGRLLAARAEASRQGLIYKKSEEVGRVVLATTLSAAAVQQQLTAFLGRLSQSAEQQGARHGINNRAVAVALPSQGTGDTRALSPVAENAALAALAANVAASDDVGSVVVVAQASDNAFQGEQVNLTLHPYDNVLLYPKDTVIAARAIDGSRSETDILSALQHFLSSQVRPAALQKGLIPQIDPLTGKPLVGAIDEQTSLALVQQIQKIGVGAHVTASAAEDIYSSGPLRLRLSAAPAAPLDGIP